MKRLRAARWRGARRHPRRVASLDSLLMIDQVDSIASEQSEGVEMHENATATRTSSGEYSNVGHGTTQPGGLDDEPQRVEGEGSKSASSSLQLPPGAKIKSNTLMDWASEISALVTAFCCLLAIFIILLKFNNQQQPDWPYASALNLSTLIALIATILRSMLEVVLDSGIGQLKWRWFRSTPRPLSHVQIFEDASRGAWGSLVFMRSLARFNLATLGSIITVLSLVIGTFTQQAIQTVSCQKPSSNGIASLPIAQTTLKGIQTTSESDPGSYLTKDLKASLVAGLAGARQPNSFSPICSSGNCAFKTVNGTSFFTAGFSSECIDISSLITQTGSGIDTWAANGSYSETDPILVTNYTLPNGPTLSYQLMQNYGIFGGRWTSILAQAQFGSQYFPLIRNISMTQRQRDLIFGAAAFDGISILMPTINPCEKPSDCNKYFYESEMTVMPTINASSCPDLELPGVHTLPGYFSVTAAACVFYASLQQYEGSIVNGVLEEKAVQDSIPIRSSGISQGPRECWRCMFADPCVVDHVVYTNSSANLSSVPGGTTVFQNTTGPLRCLYGFAYPWYRALQAGSGLWRVIRGSDNLEQNRCISIGNYTSMICPDSWWLNDIFNGGDASIASIDAFMKRGFDSLSGQLRSIGTDWDGSPTFVSGTAYDTVVCVLFRWEWLFYPLALVVGAMVLLLLLLASSSRTTGSRREVIWKSSVLPFLFYGLEDQFREKATQLAPQGELNGVAKTINTRFSSGDDGWRFHT